MNAGCFGLASGSMLACALQYVTATAHLQPPCPPSSIPPTPLCCGSQVLLGGMRRCAPSRPSSRRETPTSATAASIPTLPGGGRTTSTNSTSHICPTSPRYDRRPPPPPTPPTPTLDCTGTSLPLLTTPTTPPTPTHGYLDPELRGPPTPGQAITPCWRIPSLVAGRDLHSAWWVKPVQHQHRLNGWCWD